jgi:hypothetical protein
VGLVALLDLGVLFVLVLFPQVWLLSRRLRKPGHWRKSKTVVFYAIGLENFSMFLHCSLLSRVSPVLHLVFDYSQFLLFTCIFYYFTLHTFQIMGRMQAIRVTIYILTAINILYLSSFTVYVAVQMITDEVGSYCKSTFSLRCPVARYARQCLRTQPAASGRRALRFPLPQSQVPGSKQTKGSEAVDCYFDYTVFHVSAARLRLL